MFAHAAILAIVAYAASAEPCEWGWRYLPSTQSCYKLMDQTTPWSVAEIKCLYEGAHHVSIGSYEENQFVYETAHRQEVWVGAAFFGSSYEYTYSDHTPFGYFENWESGSRPAMNRARRCIKINPYGKWFQSCCKKLAVTVCKKAASPSWQSTNSLDRRF